MARQFFPWILVLAISLSTVFAMLGGGILNRWRTLLSGLCWAAFLGLIAAAMIIMTDGGGPAQWAVDFMAIPISADAARLGVENSLVGVLVCWLIALVYGYVFFLDPAFGDRSSDFRPQGGSHIQGSACLGMVAVALAWFSSSYWTLLMAQALSVLAGWTVLSSLANSRLSSAPAFAQISVTFLREKAGSMALLILGGGICASSGASLDWTRTSLHLLPVSGVALILFGCLLQMGMFPAISWNTRLTGGCSLPSSVRLLLVNPAQWVSFVVVLRLFGTGTVQFQSLAMPILVAVLLTTLVALVAKPAQAALTHVSASLSGLAVAVLLLAGVRQGAAFFLTSQLLLWGAALFLRRPSTGTRLGRIDHWVAGLLPLAICAGPGTVSAAALLALLEGSRSSIILSLSVAAWIFFSLAMVRAMALGAAPTEGTVEQELGMTDRTSAGWRATPAVVLALISTSILWTGDLVGRFSGHEFAPVGPNWSGALFGTETLAFRSAPMDSIVWGWMLTLVVLVSVDSGKRLARAELGFLRLASDGYRVSMLVDRTLQLMVRALLRADRGLAMIEAHATDLALARGFGWVCSATAAADRWLRDRFDRLVRGAIEIPAKGVQLLQAGSVQFYILFAVGFVLAMLLHFWSHLNS